MTSRYIFTSGCFYCPSLMAKPPTEEAYLAPPLVQWSRDNDIKLMPMRCPETEFSGPDREPHGHKYYNELPGFRDHCAVIAKHEADRIVKYEAFAVIGVTTSPACGTNFGGKNPYQPSGIYMEELHAACKERAVNIPFISVWPKHHHKMIEKLASLLEPQQGSLIELMVSESEAT